MVLVLPVILFVFFDFDGGVNPFDIDFFSSFRQLLRGRSAAISLQTGSARRVR